VPLALIPARAGSKGLPGKNTRDLCGKPLLAYTIEAALSSEVFERVVVSTEDEGIAKIARAHGAETPFMRPAELATDEAASMDVVLHAVDWLRDHEGYKPSMVTLLQPTSPLRGAAYIADAYSTMKEACANRLVSLKPVADHHYWYFNLERGRIRPVIGEFSTLLRRQDLPDVFAVNGAIYMSETETLMLQGSFFGEDTYGFVMDRRSSINIDDEIDFNAAETALKEGSVGGDKGAVL
jgi:N-acylneuraminate cytidylyltransferase/CMP-N,N'-diacetyllegionaminic acid synthase